jgi:hypothetical protein
MAHLSKASLSCGDSISSIIEGVNHYNQYRPVLVGLNLLYTDLRGVHFQNRRLLKVCDHSVLCAEKHGASNKGENGGGLEGAVLKDVKGYGNELAGRPKLPPQKGKTG